MKLITVILVVAIVLVANEIYWRSFRVHGEFSRKFIHISVGSFVAFWPFLMSWNQVRLLSLLFLVGILMSKYLQVFKAIHAVERPTVGELLFATSALAVSAVTHNKWYFAASLLQMSLADGLASVIGVSYGKSTNYKILGHSKSLAGSLTCLLASLAIFIVLTATGYLSLSALQIGALALGVTALENIGIYGLDNLLVPLGVALVLSRL